MKNLRIIDADGHVQERDANWQELLDPPYRNHAPSMVECADGRKHLLAGRKNLGEAERHRLRYRHRADYPQAAARPPVCSIRCNASRHGHGRHRHRGQLRHHGVPEPAVSREP